jgi:hypothetical protein
MNVNFVQDFGVFFGNDKFVKQANSFGIPIMGSSAPVNFLTPGTTIPSGFGAQYQEGYDNMYPDQAHHFAAFFELGYFAGATAGAAAAYYLDGITPSKFNGGDVALGIYASQLGADLRAGSINSSKIRNAIRQTLCQH